MSWPTRRQAVAWIRRAMRRGGVIRFHADDCAVARNEPCDCSPRMVVVRK